MRNGPIDLSLTREEARRAGYTLYASSRPCTSGHQELRYVANDQCATCRKTYRARKAVNGRQCSVEGCNKISESKGFCPAHYGRWKDHGDPLGGRTSYGDGLKWIADHVDHKGDDCLIWPFSREKDDETGEKWRGVTFIDGQVTTAYIVMCRLAHGKKPEDKQVVAHSCGNGSRGCIHPGHLRWATYVENEADKRIHGTAIFGSRSPNAKLSEVDVKRIKTLSDIVPHRSLAKMFGVNHSTIGKIHRGEAWREVD